MFCTNIQQVFFLGGGYLFYFKICISCTQIHALKFKSKILCKKWQIKRKIYIKKNLYFKLKRHFYTTATSLSLFTFNIAKITNIDINVSFITYRWFAYFMFIRKQTNKNKIITNVEKTTEWTWIYHVLRIDA